MVSDKFQAWSVGTVNQITRRPIKGSRHSPPIHLIMCGTFAEQMQFMCDIGLSAVKAELVWSISTITL